jgi:hypothetical protein
VRPEVPGGSAGARVNGGTLLVATASEPSTLLPPLAATPNEQAVVDQLFERLADPGDSLGLVGDAAFRPRLARAWTVDARLAVDHLRARLGGALARRHAGDGARRGLLVPHVRRPRRCARPSRRASPTSTR